jgi:hypothetical protein
MAFAAAVCAAVALAESERLCGGRARRSGTILVLGDNGAACRRDLSAAQKLPSCVGRS